MQRVILIIMLTALVGMISYSWSSKTPETSTALVEQEAVAQQSDDYPLIENHETERQQDALRQPNLPVTIDGKAYAEQLVSLEGKSLFSEFDQFWAQCEQANNCKVQLSQLESELPKEWFELLSNYPALYSEWKTMESTIPLDSVDDLEARVALFKQSAQQIWGELAHQLFSDQFAHLDFTLSAKAVNSIEANEFTLHYQKLLSQWQSKAEALNVETKAQQYELAMSLLPSNFSPTELASIKAELQEIYLDESQASNIVAREQQVAKQQQTVATYHEQFAQLKSSLDVLRSTSHRDWSTQEWDTYYQQQVSGFRETFFK
ncbi:Chromosome partitioning protein ParA [Vibrio chagasii]|nr:Chromosome partitioning protein ParA [Vibrio chagasii]CAH6916448.1 Chromosome partitioning protein ParA [Vibrio chagasii]CAH6939854.1 Chromosome partitioning protein ParA [Vibrio chagasii]CAH7192591.1 Chromosome partitioning protein ParA [Vibrio chagasii]CAH7249850.1 Chromosome partitioning protein ParA [Vibrio chagasii]